MAENWEGVYYALSKMEEFFNNKEEKTNDGFNQSNANAGLMDNTCRGGNSQVGTTHTKGNNKNV
jgi:hypothetical protein